MNKYKKLVSNTAVIGIGTFGSKFLVFLLLRFYTDCLSPAQLGDADIITQTANLLMPVVCAGITDGVFRFALDRHEDKRYVFSVGVFTILCGSVILLLLTPIFQQIKPLTDYLGRPGYLWLISVYVIAACYHSLCSQFARARGNTKLFAIQGILATALNILFNLIFLLGFQMKVVGYVLSIVIADILSTLFLLWIDRLWRFISYKYLDRTLIRRMLRYSVPLIPTTVFWWVTNASDRFMVKAMLGSEANGLYSAAYRIPTLLILASGIFIEAWQFSAVTEADSSHREEHRRFFGIVFGSFQALIFFAGAVLIAFTRVIAAILFASDFYASWSYIPVLVFATVFSSLVTFMGSVYLVDKKSVLSLLTSLVGAGLNIILNFLLIPRMGPNGAGIATFFSYFVVFILRAVSSRKRLPFDLHLVRLCLNSIIMTVQTLFLVFSWPLWILVQVLCVCAMIAVNFQSLYRGVRQVLSRGAGKLASSDEQDTQPNT